MTLQLKSVNIDGEHNAKSKQLIVPVLGEQYVAVPVFRRHISLASIKSSIICPRQSVVVLPYNVLWALKSPVTIKGSGSWFKINSKCLTVNGVVGEI